MTSYNLNTVADVVALQQRLTELGYLDPPADGGWGPVSRWALNALCRDGNVAMLAHDSVTLSPEIIKLLNDAKPLPLALDIDTLAGEIARAMYKKGYWIARHPDCTNIAYVEGINPDGTANDNRVNAFNDLRSVIQIQADGTPVLLGAWEATTEPGNYWTNHPMNSVGAFHIALGQYKSWSCNFYHTHEAWTQVAPITGYRDPHRTGHRDYAHPVSGVFGVHQHWGYDLPVNDIRNSSAGCLVGRATAGHREFMRITKADPRFLVNAGYRVMTAILSAADILPIK